MVTDYDKQKKDIFNKLHKKEILVHDIVDMLIDARQQRDEYKTNIKSSRTRNYNLKKKILKTAKQLKKVRENILN